MFVQAGTTLLGLWVLSLGEMLKGRRRDVELRGWMGWAEGLAGLASSLFWTGECLVSFRGRKIES